MYEWYASSVPQVNIDEECPSFAAPSSAASSSNMDLSACGKRHIIDFAKLLHEMFEMETGSSENKTELDKYLEDPC